MQVRINSYLLSLASKQFSCDCFNDDDVNVVLSNIILESIGNGLMAWSRLDPSISSAILAFPDASSELKSIKSAYENRVQITIEDACQEAMLEVKRAAFQTFGESRLTFERIVEGLISMYLLYKYGVADFLQFMDVWYVHNDELGVKLFDTTFKINTYHSLDFFIKDVLDAKALYGSYRHVLSWRQFVTLTYNTEYVRRYTMFHVSEPLPNQSSSRNDSYVNLGLHVRLDVPREIDMISFETNN